MSGELRENDLLAHDNAEASAPDFRDSYARDFQFGRQIAQERAGGGVEVKRSSDKIHQRWSGLQLDSIEISVPTKTALLEMAANAQPILRGLKRKMNGSLAFNSRIASLPERVTVRSE
jgi:hypothetical protein